MLNNLSDIAPKAAIAAALLWGGASYLFIGPEVASRVARTDSLPVCEANFRDAATRMGKQLLSSLPEPALDAGKEMAVTQMRQFRSDPLMGELNRMGLGGLIGIDRAMNMVDAQYEQQKQAAVETYNRAADRIKQQTATALGAAGSVCGCLADAAIADTRTEWAIFAGTLGFIRPAPIKSFDARMAQLQQAGRCTGKAGA